MHWHLSTLKNVGRKGDINAGSFNVIDEDATVLPDLSAFKAANIPSSGSSVNHVATNDYNERIAITGNVVLHNGF